MDRLEKLAEKIRKNEFDAKVFNTKEEAVEYIAEACKGKTIGIGDSHTITSIGLIEALKKQGNEIYACQINKEREYKLKTLTTNVFILSANAVSEETGELVNVDSSCNRIAGSLYGPDNVIFVVGKNKIAKDLPEAINRARNIAAPMNSKVHNYNLPCAITGICHNCSSPERICRATVIYHKKPKPFNFGLVVIINEDLGF